MKETFVNADRYFLINPDRSSNPKLGTDSRVETSKMKIFNKFVVMYYDVYYGVRTISK